MPRLNKKDHRDKLQREKDLLRTAELYLQGKRQSEIAEEIGVTQQQISLDLKELRKRWLDKSIEKIDEKKAEELAKIDQLERKYWDAWQMSCDYVIKETTSNNRRVKVLIPHDQNNPLGDTKYLAGVQWCINKRCQILGVDAPQKIAGPDGKDVVFKVKFE
jgi:predicted transcriptional regulator